MQASDQAIMAQAHRALTLGDLATARANLAPVVARHPGVAQVRHLAAIIERRAGKFDAALAHVEAALSATPNDPDLCNSYANLLTDLGDLEAACVQYRRALTLQPDRPDILVNLANTTVQLGGETEAQAALERAVALAPDSARAWQSLGALWLETGEPQRAAEAFDRAQAVDPANLAAAQGRAIAEANLGGDALPFYVRARTLAPQDRNLALAEAMARVQAGDPQSGRTALEALVTAHPDFAEAHTALSRLVWQGGDSDRFTTSFESALKARPGDPALWLGRLGALMRASQFHNVLDLLPAARPALGGLADGLEAAAASEAGDPGRADLAFQRTRPDLDPGLRPAYLAHLLRAGRPDAAAAFAQTVLKQYADPVAWPYLATAWRLLNDPRWAWLEGDPAFVQALDLPISADDLARLAETLRGLHRSLNAPYEQTLRHGTQTEGALLSRREPDIQRLKAAFREAVSVYLARLPDRDAGHPLLGSGRDRFRFDGSWSVRLRGSGHHVNHVHSTAWISSAFYVTTPDEIALEGDAGPGWLTFGAPPSTLGLTLEPFRAIAPRPGRLALFPSTLWHGTLPFAAGERMTVAFDVVPVR